MGREVRHLTVKINGDKGALTTLDNGVVVAEARATTSSVNNLTGRPLEKSLGFAQEWIQSCFYKAKTDVKTSGDPEHTYVFAEDATTFEPKPEKPAPVPTVFSLWVRGEQQSRGEAAVITAETPTEAMTQALAAACAETDPLIEWKTDQLPELAALDVDFHETDYATRPTPADVVQYRPKIHPQPVFAWSTHGRGVRGIYVAADGWRADELAAAAVFSVQARWPEATYEIKAVTRHPAFPRSNGQTAGPVLRGIGPTDISPLRAALTEAEDASADAGEQWRKAHGFVAGARYDHTRCPFSPSHRGGRTPVVAYSDGVHCHYCRAKGGRSYASYAALARGLVASEVAKCARKFAHWEHAQHVVEQALNLRGTVARLCYRVALKLLHGIPDEDARLNAAFATDNDLLRFGGFWTNRHGELLPGDLGPMLAALPATWIPPHADDEEPKYRPSAPKVCRFGKPASLDDEGYPAISPIWGGPIGTRFIPPRHGTTHVVCYPDDLRHRNHHYRPKYLDAKHRPNVAEAWATLEGPFPGLPRAYVELLVAARGCAELRHGKPPAVYVSGPSGSAKSSCVNIAAAICGDKCTEAKWTKDESRFLQAIAHAAQSGTFCAINEAVKNGRVEDRSPVDVMDVMLNLTEGVIFHKLYVGPVPLGRLPVFVWTETDLPEDIAGDKQLARRLVWVPLQRQVFWEDSQIAHGVGKAELVRISSPEFAEACDVILSDVIDKYFREPSQFDVVAAAIGYKTVQHAGQDTSHAILKAFYAAVQEAPKLDPDFYGPGWASIEASHEGKLAKLWRQISDAEGTSSRKCEAEDWARLLGEAEDISFKVRKHERGIAVRFSRGGLRAAGLLPDQNQLEPRPEENGADRPGNAIGSGFASDWLAGLPAASFHAVDVPRGEVA